jgi:hypothetical protein
MSETTGNKSSVSNINKKIVYGGLVRCQIAIDVEGRLTRGRVVSLKVIQASTGRQCSSFKTSVKRSNKSLQKTTCANMFAGDAVG